MIFVVAFLAVQIGVPTIALFGPRPARFAWQMYSGVRTPASFEIVRGDGSTEDVVLMDYLGQPRGDIDLIDILPAHICEVEPDAVAIRIDPAGTGKPSETPCNH